MSTSVPFPCFPTGIWRNRRHRSSWFLWVTPACFTGMCSFRRTD